MEDSITKTLQRIDPSRDIKFLAYLRMVTKNRALDWLRKFLRQKAYMERASTDLLARSAFAEAISHEALKTFDIMVKRLSKKERRAIVMKVVGQLTFEEISKKMKVPPSHVRQLVFRARGRLQVWMKDLVS